MENATKALLIAASVLIVIVLVALGVALLNSSPDVTGQAKSVGESTAIQAFNGQFTSYLGDNQSAAMVRTVMTVARTSNKNSAENVAVYHKGSTKVSDLVVQGNEKGTLKNWNPTDGKAYIIEVKKSDGTSGYNTDGRIEYILITDK